MLASPTCTCAAQPATQARQPPWVCTSQAKKPDSKRHGSSAAPMPLKKRTPHAVPNCSRHTKQHTPPHSGIAHTPQMRLCPSSNSTAAKNHHTFSNRCPITATRHLSHRTCHGCMPSLSSAASGLAMYPTTGKAFLCSIRLYSSRFEGLIYSIFKTGLPAAAKR